MFSHVSDDNVVVDCGISVGCMVVRVEVNFVVVVVVVMVVVVVPTASHESIHRSKLIKHSSSHCRYEQLCKQWIQLLWQFSWHGFGEGLSLETILTFVSVAVTDEFSTRILVETTDSVMTRVRPDKIPKASEAFLIVNQWWVILQWKTSTKRLKSSQINFNSEPIVYLNSFENEPFLYCFL